MGKERVVACEEGKDLMSCFCMRWMPCWRRDDWQFRTAVNESGTGPGALQDVF